MVTKLYELFLEMNGVKREILNVGLNIEVPYGAT